MKKSVAILKRVAIFIFATTILSYSFYNFSERFVASPAELSAAAEIVGNDFTRAEINSVVVSIPNCLGSATVTAFPSGDCSVVYNYDEPERLIGSIAVSLFLFGSIWNILKSLKKKD